jgi:hypothetical protein
MRIRVFNCPDKEFKPYITDAVEFYSESLFSNKMLESDLNIKVKFNDKLTVYGYASIIGYNKSKKARKFLIELHPGIGSRRILETLAHEMVHVKQFAYNETNEKLSRWQGTKINPEQVDYFDHPWEIEAYGKEVGLFTKYAIHNQLWHVFSDIRNPDDPIEIGKINWKM